MPIRRHALRLRGLAQRRCIMDACPQEMCPLANHERPPGPAGGWLPHKPFCHAAIPLGCGRYARNGERAIKRVDIERVTGKPAFGASQAPFLSACCRRFLAMVSCYLGGLIHSVQARHWNRYSTTTISLRGVSAHLVVARVRGPRNGCPGRAGFAARMDGTRIELDPAKALDVARTSARTPGRALPAPRLPLVACR